MKTRTALLCAIGLASIGAGANSQDLPSVPGGSVSSPPERPGPASERMDDVAVQSLAKAEGLTPEGARTFIRDARKLQAVVARLIPEQLPGLAGSYLDNKPTTKLTVLYVGDLEAFKSKIGVPPELSSMVEFKASVVPIADLLKQQQDLLNSPLLKDLVFATYLDQRNNNIVLQVENGPAFEAIRRLTPNLLPKGTKLIVAPLPKQQAGTQPAGSYPPQSGDYIEGGRWYHTINTDGSERRECTFAFGAKFGVNYGVLTAGHCEPGTLGTGYYYPFGSHWVEMWGPDYESVNPRTKYDFQFHRTPGMKVYNTVAIFDTGDNVTDWLYVEGTEPRSLQTSGFPTCKYGRVSKLGCYTIADNYYFFTNEENYRTGPWVLVNSNTSISVPGDSGGPIMNISDGGYVKARGILSRGGYQRATGKYEMIYMPIDHIDDVNPISVLTSPSP